MKKFILLALALIGSQSYAYEEALMDTFAAGLESSHKFNFAVNKELGRAWIVLEEYIYDGEGGSSRHETKLKVSGLRFDSRTSSIVYEKDGARIECAQLIEKGRFIFRREVIQPTGRCVITEHKYSTQVDDGFYIRSVPKVKIVFSAN